MMVLFRRKKKESKVPPPWDPSLMAAPTIPCTQCGRPIAPGARWLCVAAYHEGGRFDRNYDLHPTCVLTWTEKHYPRRW